MSSPTPPKYECAQGTIKVSGSTLPRQAGSCALHFLTRLIDPIDFICIGANANQQAVKAIGVFSEMFEEQHGRLDGSYLAFRPLRVSVTAKNFDGSSQLKDATVWRTVIVRPAKFLPVPSPA